MALSLSAPKLHEDNGALGTSKTWELAIESRWGLAPICTHPSWALVRNSASSHGLAFVTRLRARSCSRCKDLGFQAFSLVQVKVADAVRNTTVVAKPTQRRSVGVLRRRPEQQLRDPKTKERFAKRSVHSAFAQSLHPKLYAANQRHPKTLWRRH